MDGLNDIPKTISTSPSSGTHAVVFGSSAITWRKAGWQVRDTIAVFAPGPIFVDGLLLRWPLDGGIAETVLEHGTGALNIDACRVDAGMKQATAGRRTVRWGVGIGGSSYELGTGAIYSTEGRWPANILIVHEAGCQRVERYREFRGQAHEVPSWVCVDACPAILLDATSGTLRARGNVSPTRRDRSDGITGWGVGQPGPTDPGDIGGATRFFPQFASFAELTAWLERLLVV